MHVPSPQKRKHVPRTHREILRWLLDRLAVHPRGLTPSATVNLYFQEYRAPLNVPEPDFHNDYANLEAAGDDEFFIHSKRTLHRDPLRSMMANIEGVIHDAETNKFVLMDYVQIFSIHMYATLRKSNKFEVFKRLDKDGNGKINCVEFLSLVRDELKLEESQFPDEEIIETFKTLDSDDSGSITVLELIDFCSELAT
uniref:EF-hand domain-containing protein n=1 Tax=Octactis speculum TaxID=3111310 RepID=A0A7S2DMQ7_9STRA|mmetsp:Transcript_51506/g.70158  ORF Transcript_51506/g.70158 Transcript_51506/m.70158 type:complete len:197 (+) Transcript_51506:47-637(+)